jgi:tripartite-type tricarboxylate transporter receptor subunit TctC
MQIPRRHFLPLAGGAAVTLAFSKLAAALDYPNRPVRFVVAFFAGSLSDILARSIAPSFSKHLGQEVIVDDQPGAGGNLATNMVVRASPDGYTLLEATSANVWNAALYDTLSVDFIRDIAPVATISRTPAVMTVTHLSPPRLFPSSSPMPRPIRAKSIWLRAASVVCRMLLESFSSL